jgi:drug/metabolite transporter (DMT)-like permease
VTPGVAATASAAESRRAPVAPVVFGAVGVVLFSGSFPATKFALEGFSPWFVSFGRAALAAVLAGGALLALRARRPTRRQLVHLVLAAFAVVVGSPLLMAFALERTTSSHAVVIFALLPIVTSIFAVVRGGERPGRLFWVAALAGVAIVAAFALQEAHGRITLADAYLLLGVVVCSGGYSEGGIAARNLGGLETICWALIVSLPLTLTGALFTLPASAPSAHAIEGFLYVSLFSMFLGFVAWYAGLAGGIAKVSQLQLFQPILTVVWSALLLDEHLRWTTALAAVGVIASVALTQGARIRP